jgi:hypothetical protein
MSNNINSESSSLYNSLIQRAQSQKERSQQALSNFQTNTQAQINTARQEITRLDAEITQHNQKLTEIETKINNPPRATTRRARRARRAARNTNLIQQKTQKDLLQNARDEVKAARGTAAEKEAKLAKGLEVQDPNYLEAKKLFGVLSHIDKIINLKRTGQNYSQDRAQLNTKLSEAETISFNKMGSEFITKFWEDVANGLIELKGTTPPPTTTPAQPVNPTPAQPVNPTPAQPVNPTPAQPVNPTPAQPVNPTPAQPVNPTPEGFVGNELERPIFDYLYDALAPGNEQTKGAKVSQMNKLLATRLMETSLGGVQTSDGTTYSMVHLLNEIGEIYGDQRANGATGLGDNFDGFTGAIQNYLNSEMINTRNSTMTLKHTDVLAVMNVMNRHSGGVSHLQNSDRNLINTNLGKLDQAKEFISSYDLAASDNSFTKFYSGLAQIFGDQLQGEGGIQYSGFTGAMQNGLSAFNVESSQRLSVSHKNAVLDNLETVKDMYNIANITNPNPNRTPTALNAYFYSDTALDSVLIERTGLQASIGNLNQRLSAVRNNESNESLQSLTLELNKHNTAANFSRASEEFWSKEKSFPSPRSVEPELLVLYERMRGLEDDFIRSTLGEPGLAGTLTTLDYGNKISAINGLRVEINELKGPDNSRQYSVPIPNPGLINQVSEASYKFESYSKESIDLVNRINEYDEGISNGHPNHSPAQLVVLRNAANMSLSITNFKKDFWDAENNFYQDLLGKNIPNNKASELNDLLNQLYDQQLNIDTLMTDLGRTGTASQVARSRITTGRNQIASIKQRINALG